MSAVAPKTKPPKPKTNETKKILISQASLEDS